MDAGEEKKTESTEKKQTGERLLVTVSDAAGLWMAKAMFASAVIEGKWTGSMGLIAVGIPQRERKRLDWFRDRGIRVAEVLPIFAGVGDDRLDAVAFSKFNILDSVIRASLHPDGGDFEQVIYTDVDCLVRRPLEPLLDGVVRIAAMRDPGHSSLAGEMADGSIGVAAASAGTIVFQPVALHSTLLADLCGTARQRVGAFKNGHHDQPCWNAVLANTWEWLPDGSINLVSEGPSRLDGVVIDHYCGQTYKDFVGDFRRYLVLADSVFTDEKLYEEELEDVARNHRILTIHHGGIGDTVLHLHAMMSGPVRNPDLEWTCLGTSYGAQEVLKQNLVRTVDWHDVGYHLVVQPGPALPGAFIEECVKADTILVFQHGTRTLEDRIRRAAMGDPDRVVMIDYRAEDPGSENRHVCQVIKDRLDAVGLGHAWTTDLWSPPDHIPCERVKQARPARVALHPGSGDHIKDWPAEAWIALASGLRSCGKKIIWILGPNEVRDERFRWVPDEPAGKTDLVCVPKSLSDFLGAIAEAGLYIGNDAGPTHLAAATGMPTVAIFTGPNLAARPSRHWRPLGPNVTVVEPDTVSPSVASVMDATAASCLVPVA